MCCKVNFKKINYLFRCWCTKFSKFEEATVAVNKNYECFRVEIEKVGANKFEWTGGNIVKLKRLFLLMRLRAVADGALIDKIEDVFSHFRPIKVLFC